MTEYRILLRQEVRQQLAILKRAAATQQAGGLRRRELESLELGLRALAHGQEELFLGKRLGRGIYDLSDCAELKLAVVPETRGRQDLGPSHRLLYREFEATDGGLPYREVVAFEPRKDDRPFVVAAARLGRLRGVSIQRLEAVVATRASAPIRKRRRPKTTQHAPTHRPPPRLTAQPGALTAVQLLGA